MVAIERKLLDRLLERSGFMTHLLDLELDGKKHRVLPRDVQFDPVSDVPLHVDFLRVSASTRVRVNVPVVFINAERSPAIKRGGTLNIVHHEIEVTCAPGSIPQKFEVNLEELQMHEAVHLNAIKLPEGVELVTHERDFTIASIVAPSAVRAEQEAAAAAAQAAAAPAADAAAAPAADAAKAGDAKAGAGAKAGAAKAPEAKKADKK
jgi:large subunit ribosomal protein L25